MPASPACQGLAPESIPGRSELGGSLLEIYNVARGAGGLVFGARSNGRCRAELASVW